jgi:hypothetical protein
MKNLALLALTVLAFGAAACASQQPMTAQPSWDANAIRQRAGAASAEAGADTPSDPE